MLTSRMNNKAFLYRDVLEFINRDVCSYFMRRLAAHHSASYQHSLRVALYSMTIADLIGIKDQERISFLRSVLLHDIGLLGVPNTILNKKDPLSPEEWEAIRKHSMHGIELLSSLIDNDYIDRDIVLYHHENLDGSGYPHGKMENELSMLVRIVRVTDSYDSMICARNGLPKSKDEALAELYRWSGVCYDSKVVRCLHHMAIKDWQQ